MFFANMARASGAAPGGAGDPQDLIDHVGDEVLIRLRPRARNRKLAPSPRSAPRFEDVTEARRPARPSDLDRRAGRATERRILGRILGLRAARSAQSAFELPHEAARIGVARRQLGELARVNQRARNAGILPAVFFSLEA